jgi:hypothetical protein
VRNIAVEKEINITCYGGVSVVLVIQHAKLMRYIICVLSSVACPAVQHSSTLSLVRHDFLEEKKSCETKNFDFL